LYRLGVIGKDEVVRRYYPDMGGFDDIIYLAHELDTSVQYVSLLVSMIIGDKATANGYRGQILMEVIKRRIPQEGTY
jgi:hypothetical protein